MSEAVVEIALSRRLYPRQCIGVAISAFSDLCDVNIVDHSGNATLLRVQPLTEAMPHAVQDFLNYALMASLEWHLSQAS